jgi:hypothetical protein
MLLFSAEKGRLPYGMEKATGMPAVESAIRLNILGIILLADPSETFTQVSSREDPSAFGVDSIRKLQGREESESVVEEEPFL